MCDKCKPNDDDAALFLRALMRPVPPEATEGREPVKPEAKRSIFNPVRVREAK